MPSRVPAALAAAFAVLAAAGAEAAPDPGAVKRELWATEISLGEARVELHGLQAVTADTQAYDAQLAEELRGRAANDLRASEQRLTRLWRLPGQDDARLVEVSRLTDAARGLRVRIEQLGHSTTAHLDPRPDTRTGAGGKPRKPPEGNAMPEGEGDKLRGTEGELKAAWAQLEELTSGLRALAEHYGVTDSLVSP